MGFSDTSGTRTIFKTHSRSRSVDINGDIYNDIIRELDDELEYLRLEETEACERKREDAERKREREMQNRVFQYQKAAAKRRFEAVLSEPQRVPTPVDPINGRQELMVAYPKRSTSAVERLYKDWKPEGPWNFQDLAVYL